MGFVRFDKFHEQFLILACGRQCHGQPRKLPRKVHREHEQRAGHGRPPPLSRQRHHPGLPELKQPSEESKLSHFLKSKYKFVLMFHMSTWQNCHTKSLLAQLAGFYCFLFALVVSVACLALSSALTMSPYYACHSSLERPESEVRTTLRSLQWFRVEFARKWIAN